ncbi:hypothetical protein XENOCAPTIV_026932 [Xenoophorus captivus]|uniref:Uncharacterized protein n=1 Tax=Xenoophorus captivus TaxID=1517983 RepID=A0ABV0QWR8_9TELE
MSLTEYPRPDRELAISPPWSLEGTFLLEQFHPQVHLQSKMTSPTPPLPLPPLFGTLPVPLNYSPTPALGISPHQRLCAPLIRRTVPVVTITKESCREPESRPCGNQKAIPALLNLSAPLTATVSEESRGESRQHCTEGKKL